MRLGNLSSPRLFKWIMGCSHAGNRSMQEGAPTGILVWKPVRIRLLGVWKHMGTSHLLCHLESQAPGHQNWNLQPKAEVGNLFPFGPVAQGCGPKSVEIATGFVSFLEAPDIEKKTKFRPSSSNMKGRSGPPTHLKEDAKPL